MKTTVLLAAASVLLASSLLATNALAQSSAPPPPGINDPGVKAVAPPAQPAAATRSSPATTSSTVVPLDLKPQALPAMQEDKVAPSSKDLSLPQVRVHQEGNNTIQEYSRSGRVYMVVVTPKSGIEQTYMVDPQGRLVDEHGQKPVGPVMYKLMEWGKSKPAPEDSTETAPADSSH